MSNSNYDSRRKHIDPEALIRLSNAGYAAREIAETLGIRVEKIRDTARALRLTLATSPKGGRR